MFTMRLCRKKVANIEYYSSLPSLRASQLSLARSFSERGLVETKSAVEASPVLEHKQLENNNNNNNYSNNNNNNLAGQFSTLLPPTPVSLSGDSPNLSINSSRFNTGELNPRGLNLMLQPSENNSTNNNGSMNGTDSSMNGMEGVINTPTNRNMNGNSGNATGSFATANLSRKPSTIQDESETTSFRNSVEPQIHNYARPNLANPFAGLGGPQFPTPNRNVPNYSNLNSTPQQQQQLPLLQQQLIQQQQHQQHLHQQHQMQQHQQLQQQQQFQQQGPSGSRSYSVSNSITQPSDGGPPYVVPLYNIYTRSSLLPPGVTFPSIELRDQSKVKQWMDTDKYYEKELNTTKRKVKSDIVSIGNSLYKQEDWLGAPDAGSRARMKIMNENDRLKEKSKGKRGNARSIIKLSKEKLKAVALEPEILIPIRLEFEYEAYKLRDTFTWNLRETIITPEIFATHLVEDMRLPANPFVKEIISQINRHIEDARMTEEYEAHLGDDLSAVREANRNWFANDFKKKKLDNEIILGEERPLFLREFAPHEGENEELRVMIKLDITLDSVQLVDKFEWDLSNSRNSPEEFADSFTADLGLPGEFRTAIAHSIREQLDVVVKSLCLLGHVHGLAVVDDELRREFLPSLYETFRSDPTDYTPSLNQLTPEEVDRNDKEREREVRRKRRQTKGRGVTLPDREHVKTHRTLVPKPSNVWLTPYTDARGDTIFPLGELSRPYPFIAPPTPEKPILLETVAASPLKIVTSKASTQFSAGENLLRPVSRLKRLRQGGSPFGGIEESTPGESSTRAASPVVSIEPIIPKVIPSPSKPGPKSTKVRKPPVIKPSLEELGVREHIINSVWHCAGCGIPESLSTGRRKGPSGAGTLCGQCGKYWNQNSKLRECVYSTDIAFHQAEKSKKTKSSVPVVKKEFKAKRVKVEAKEKLVTSTTTPATTTTTTTTNSAQSPHQVQSRQTSEEVDTPLQQDSDSDSDSSAASPIPQPLASNNGRKGSPDPPFIGSPASDMSSLSSVSPQALPNFLEPQEDSPVVAPTPLPTPPLPTALPWMLTAAIDLKKRHQEDQFEYITKNSKNPGSTAVEWRIRCHDCPGKLYNVGPGETLDNFSVHFKNRQHRHNVEERIKNNPI